MKLGVQLYSIRSLCKDDLEAGIRTAAEIGYEGVEFAGFFGHSADEVAGWLKQYGVAASSAHVQWDEIVNAPDETIAFHKAIGNRRIICPWYKLETAADVKELADKFRSVWEKYEAAGMVIGYHNHAHEFAKDGGSYLIDLLAAELPELALEFDAYWVYRGGENPVDYLTKYQDRIDIFHAKDGNMEHGTLAGKGEVDLAAAADCAKKIGAEWAVVESKASEDLDEQVESIRSDYAYLRTLL